MIRAKKIIAIGLGAFVVVSIAYLAYSQIWPRAWVGDDQAVNVADGVVVYYFHSEQKCYECETIKAWTVEAMAGHFKGELADGRVSWRTVNIDNRANEHFVKEYKLKGLTLVVARMEGGRVVGWKKLDGVWDTLGDKGRFEAYVASEVGRTLDKAGETPARRADGTSATRENGPSHD
jgi:hypothetical protein